MTNSTILVRDAREDEREAIKALTMAAYEEYATIMTPSAWAGLHGALVNALASEGGERIVAERDGELVGSVMLFPPESGSYGSMGESGDWPELRLLAVPTALRGHGIGTLLVDECIRRARGHGARQLGLHTSDSLKVAIKMYEQMGFVRVPVFDFRPDGAELVMAYKLDL